MRGEGSIWTYGIALLMVIAVAIWGVVAWIQWMSPAHWLSLLYTAEGFVALGLATLMIWWRWVPAKIIPWLGAIVGIGVAQMNRTPLIVQAVHGWMRDHLTLVVGILWIMRGSLIVGLLGGLVALAWYLRRLFTGAY